MLGVGCAGRAALVTVLAGGERHRPADRRHHLGRQQFPQPGLRLWPGVPAREQLHRRCRGQPLTGTVLWTNTDVHMNAHAFGDDQFLYLVEAQNGTAGVGKALRACDGVSVDVKLTVSTLGRRMTCEVYPPGQVVVVSAR